MDKITTIKKSIDSIVSLTDEELLILCDAFEQKTLNKNAFFLEEGQVCTQIAWIQQGALIYFKTM